MALLMSTHSVLDLAIVAWQGEGKNDFKGTPIRQIY